MWLLPFSYPWIVKTHLKGDKTVLDVGSGDGKFIALLNSDDNLEVEGVELFSDYIKKARKTGAYKKIVKKDILKINYKQGSFDGVLCSQVIEHVSEKDGHKLILKMERIAKKSVIIGTPNGHFDQDEYDGNRLQKHLSFWDAKDFTEKGYVVYGQGLKYIYGEDGLLSKSPCNWFIVRHFFFLVSYLFSPLVYFQPHLAAHLIAVKKI